MAKKEKVEEDEGMSLDDAFDDDEDVEYAESKPKKIEKKSEEKEKRKKSEDDEAGNVMIKGSKPISKLKKGDRIRIDGLELQVDTHYVLIDHGNTKEMAIECFDPNKDKDYQIRYFDDNVENSIEFYELEEIMYNKVGIKKIEW